MRQTKKDIEESIKKREEELYEVEQTLKSTYNVPLNEIADHKASVIWYIDLKEELWRRNHPWKTIWRTFVN